MFCVSVAQIFGILLAVATETFTQRWQVYGIYLPFLLGILVALGWTGLQSFPKRWVELSRGVLWLLVAFAWGGITYNFSMVVLPETDIRVQMQGQEARLAVVQGELLERPTAYYRKVTNALGNVSQKEVWRVSLTLKQVRWNDSLSNSFVPISGTVRAFCPKWLKKDITAGSIVEVDGAICKPESAIIPGEFDYRQYLHTLGIDFELKTQGEENWKSLGYGHGITSLLRRGTAFFREYSVKKLSLGMEPNDPYMGMYQAMTIGERVAMDPGMKETFTHVGTMHLVAISGYNVGVIALMVGGVFSLLRVSRLWNTILSLLAILFYTLLVGADSPVNRAAVMISVILIGRIIQRPTALINSLGVAAFLMLSWEPVQLLQSSFQLSFAVVLNLILLMPFLEKYIQKTGEDNSYLPFGLLSHKIKFKRLMLIFFLTSIWTSVAGWVGSLALCIHYFQFFQISGFFVNMIVVPIAFPLQGLAVISIMFGSIIPFVSELCNETGCFLIFIIERICSFAESLPYSYMRIASWYWWSWVLYYIGIFGLFSGFFLRKKNWIWVVVYGVTLYFGIGAAKQAVVMESVVVFSVGNGSTIFVQDLDQEKDYLLDAGTEYSAKWIVTPYLRKVLTVQNQLDGVVLTHGDAEHLKGMDYFSQHLIIKKLFYNSMKMRSKYMQEWVSDEMEKVYSIVPVQRGDRIGELEVLHPVDGEDDDFTRADQKTLVLRLEKYGKRILFLSDLDPEGQQRLLDREDDLRCDVLVCGVAKYEYPFRTGLLRRCSPRFVIIESGEEKSAVVLQKSLQDLPHPPQILNTRRDGSVAMIWNKEKALLRVGDKQYNF